MKKNDKDDNRNCLYGDKKMRIIKWQLMVKSMKMGL